MSEKQNVIYLALGVIIAAEFGVYFAYLFVGFLVLGEAFEEHIESTS